MYMYIYIITYLYLELDKDINYIKMTQNDTHACIYVSQISRTVKMLFKNEHKHVLTSWCIFVTLFMKLGSEYFVSWTLALVIL